MKLTDYEKRDVLEDFMAELPEEVTDELWQMSENELAKRLSFAKGAKGTVYELDINKRLSSLQITDGASVEYPCKVVEVLSGKVAVNGAETKRISCKKGTGFVLVTKDIKEEEKLK